MNSKDVAIIFVTFMVVVLMPISIGISRRLRRSAQAAPPQVSDPAVHARLDRLENAVDAIAIEIERIAEGQRFVTKVMTERPAPAHGALPSQAEASPIRKSITPH
jgi:hypothetical protein